MATDFFERQRQARQQSLLLRGLFALALAFNAVLVAAGLVVPAAFLTLGAIFTGQRGGGGVLGDAFVHSMLGWKVAAAVLLFSVLMSAYTAWQLRGGGASLAQRLRASPVPPETRDPSQRQLLNIVTEMAIAARIPEPGVFVLDDEPGINAFAAGHPVDGAIVAVTAGALRELDRDELQAVVAHEFSHILNGDMALNTRLVAWLSGLFAIESLARAFRSDSNGKPRKFNAVFWWAQTGFWVFHTAGYTGLFIGRLLQAAICRRREALADAAAVQFTRQPDALKSALVKVEAAGSIRPLSRRTVGMAHLFFASEDVPGTSWWQQLRQRILETHPRMEDRVRVLAPRLTPQQYRAALRIERKRMLNARAQADAPVSLGGEMLAPARAATARESVHEFLCSRLNASQQQQVQALRKDIAASAQRLQALFIAALLDMHAARARQQLVKLAPVLGAPVAGLVPRMRILLFGLPGMARLQLLVVLLPSLAALPDRERLRVVKVARAFGQKLEPRDTLRFAVSRIVMRTLLSPGASRSRVKLREPVPQENADAAFGLLCSLLAQQSGGRMAAAFHAGMNGLVPPLRRPTPVTDEITADAVDHALDTVSRLPYLQRTRLCEALLRVIGANGSMGVGEFELLRLVSQSIGVTTPATGTLRLESAVSS